MRLNRFIGDFDLTRGEIEIRSPEHIHQIKNVLRLKEGDFLILCNGKGKEARAQIKSVDNHAINGAIQEVTQNTNESPTSLTLYLSLLKKENFEFACAKAVEIGVARIIPLLTTRTVKENFKKERLLKIIRESAEQSGRGIVPEILSPLRLIDGVSFMKEQEGVLFFDQGGEFFNTNEYHARNIGICIGPEGGWSEDEVHYMKEQGFRMVTLGPLTLRAETAAIVGTYVTLHREEL